MTTKPEALRLADALAGWHYVEDANMATVDEAAAELRRLHAENKVLHERHHGDNVLYTQLLAQRNALLEMLKEITPSICHVSIVPEEKCAQCGRIARARAAIAAAEGQ